MGLKLANNAISRLAAGIAAVDLSLSVTPGDGSLFPSLSAGDFFPATLVRASDGAIEIVEATARSSDVLTIARAKEGTTALAFLAGDRIEVRLTAATILGLLPKNDTAFSGDVDDLTTPGMYRTAAGATNIPDANEGTILVTESDSGTFQLWFKTPAAAVTQMYMRSIGSGAWTSWERIAGMSDIPITRGPGEVFVHAGTSAPAGSLAVPTAPTNVSRTTYAALFAAIGETWGAGDGSTTFGLPWVAADNTILQANSNVGTSTVGAILSHNHTQNAHTHTQNAHTHTQNPHSHNTSYAVYNNSANSSLGAGASSQTSSVISVTSTTATNQNTTATNQNTTATNNATGGSANVAAGARFLLCIQY